MQQEEQVVYAHEHVQQQAPTETSQIADYRQQLATQIGEEAHDLKVYGNVGSMLKRMQEGVIVSLHIEGTRRFWKRLTPEDLGLIVSGEQSAEASHILADYFQLGRLSLLPKNKELARLPEAEREKFVTQEELASLERSARYCLERYSFKSHWGSFVPLTVYMQWKEENAKYEQAFTELKERLITNYSTIVALVKETYRPYAQQAWREVEVKRSLYRDSITEQIIRDVVASLTEGKGRDTFVENYLRSIEQAIRTPDERGGSFRYAVEKGFIPLPSLVAQDLETTDSIYRQRAIRDAEVAKELERIESERRIAEAQALAAEREERDRRYQALQAEREKLQLQLRAERDIIEDAQKQKKALLEEFYRDVTFQINDQLQAVCASVLENLDSSHNKDEHGKSTLRGPVSRQLRALVNQVEGLNFMENQRIDAMIASIREALPTQKESEDAAKGTAKIDTTRLQLALRKVRDEAKAAVIDLGMTPTVRRARPEGLTSQPLETATRQKRSGDFLTELMPQPQKRRKKSYR